MISIITLSLLLANVRSVYAISDFNFGSAGDWGCGSNAKNTESNINGKNPELVLHLGDYSYQSKASCWLKIIKPVDSISKINIGNHDNSKKLLKSYLSHFDLGKAYYSFDYKNVHVLVMNTEDSKAKKTSSSQYKFVVKDLKDASQNSDIKWIIVSLHKPLFSSPNGCSAKSCKGSISLTETYQPLFDKYHVDLVLQGHVHNYQRTFPLKFNSDNPLKPTPTSSAAHDYTNPKGQIYAIVGTGGINFHTLKGKASFVSSQQALRFGQLDLKFTDNGNKLIGTFYPNGGGSSMDHFSIIKPQSSLQLDKSKLSANDVKSGSVEFLPHMIENPFSPSH